MKAILQITILFALLSLVIPVAFAASLSCSFISAASCSGVEVLYGESDDGGINNSHAQNASVATYSNAVCCTPTSDTLTLTCEDQIYGKLSATDNAHFEERDNANYNVNACLSAATNRIVCQEATSCTGDYTCLFSYSDGGDNTTNNHLGDCQAYTNKVCCQINDRPTVSAVVLNSSSATNTTNENLSVFITATEPDGEAITNITDWRVGGSSIAVLNFPFNTNTSYSTLEVKDYSTTANNLSLSGTNTPEWIAAGKISGAYLFNGTAGCTTSCSDYDLLSTSSFTLGTTVSVCAWVKPSASEIKELLIHGTIASRGSFELYQNNLEASLRGGGNTAITTSGNAFSAGSWTHLCGVISGTSASIYVNGEQNVTGTIDAPNTVSRQLFVGAYSNGQYAFNGTIDEIKVFNRSLSAAQVLALYQDESAGRPLTTIVSQETAGSETWQVAVTANDGWQDSATTLSNELTIAAGAVNIVLQNNVTNATNAHAFTLLAGASYATGASAIVINNVTNNVGTCSQISNSTSGIYFNATWNCTHSAAYVATNISMTFCDGFDNCNTTTITANEYPNQAPTMNSLLVPTNGNTSLINRAVNFSWQAATDADGDVLNYTINITNINCPDIYTQNIPDTNFTHGVDLNTTFECSNNRYFWQVRACDPWECSSFTSLYNFSIQDYLEITVSTNTVNFTTLAPGQSNDTLDGNPPPFVMENTGNVLADLTDINSTGLWSTVPLNTSYYQFRIDNTTAEPGSFAGGQLGWLFVRNTGVPGVIANALKYTTATNELEVNINITTPAAEPTGTKTDTLTFVWESTP